MKLIQGDSMEVLDGFDDDSVDAVVTDPPYGIAFMGKVWDGKVPSVELWKKVYRVLKPGGHLLCFAGTRTYHRMVVAIEDAGFSIRDMISWVYGCLDDKTEVLTTEGFKKYQDIKKDEVVACFNRETEEINYDKIKNLFVYDFDGKMINIKGRTTDQLLTPNHRVLLKEKREKGYRENNFYETKWLFKEAKNLIPNRGIKLPLAGSFKGVKSIGVEMAELIGWILTEGTINKKSGAIYICQTEKYPENINRIRYLLEKTELFYTETKGTYPYKDRTYTRHDFYIPRKNAEIIKSLIPNKKPTRELLELKREEMVALFNGLIGGDGSYKQNSDETLGEFYQKDTNILDWFQVLCLHLGYKSSQNKKKGSVSWGKKSWMGIDPSWFKRKITKVKYKGYVWCIEVPAGAFVARRNGKIFITGNSGFPKSHNVGKAVDKMQGNEREWISENPNKASDEAERASAGKSQSGRTTHPDITKGTSEWEGWHTALKPSMEPIVVARKPFKGTVAENVLQHGTGAINVDGCRVETDENLNGGAYSKNKKDDGEWGTMHRKVPGEVYKQPQGRWPANFIHSGEDEVVRLFPMTQSGGGNKANRQETRNSQVIPTKDTGEIWRHDSGSAARFFASFSIDHICTLCYNPLHKESKGETWKRSSVNSVEKSFGNTGQTKENTAQENAMQKLNERSVHYVEFAGNLCKKCATDIVQSLVVISENQKDSESLEESTVIQDFIGNYKKCILILNLANYAENLDSIDTTPTTQNLLKLFGYVVPVIKNYIQKIEKSEPARFKYQAKASKRDRDEGLDNYLTVKHNVPKEAQLCKDGIMVVVELLKRATSELTLKWSTGESGESIMAQCHKDTLSTILTETSKITLSKTLSLLMHLLTKESIVGASCGMENGGNLVENAERLNLLKVNTTNGKAELAHGVKNVVSEMLLKISEKENWQKKTNIHSTVKPTSLMQYLCRLITPPGGTVLDPFMGSGSTGKAAKLEGFDFIGIELEEEYIEIAQKRIENTTKPFYL